MGLQLNARNWLANWLEMSRLFLTWSCQTRHTSVSLPQGSLQCSTVTIRHSACCHIDRNVLPAWIHQSRSFVNVKSTMLSLHGQQPTLISTNAFRNEIWPKILLPIQSPVSCTPNGFEDQPLPSTELRLCRPKRFSLFWFWDNLKSL